MPWKLGGNFESVPMMCKASWQECTIAVADYLWFEIVSDVVDFLTKEGMIWTLAIVVISTILFCVNFRKGARANNNIKADKQILHKVGYKIQDLELKVNVLTYKMQYGTWPLPHQIYSLNPRKLQKIKMTLSNPVDHKSWIKHVLLSPMKSDMHTPCSKVHDPSVAKMTGFFDTKHKRLASHHAQRGKLSTDCSSIETSKSTSDQSVNVCSRTLSFRPRSVSAEESELSKSGDFTLQRRNNVHLLPLLNERNRRSSRMLSPQNSKSVAPMSNTKFKPCQDFTNTVHRCRSFLKELKNDDKRSRLLNHLSERQVSTLKDAHATEQTASLTADKHEASNVIRKTGSRDARRKDINEMKRATGMENEEATEDVDRVHQQSNTNASSDAAVMTNNDVTFPKQLLQDLLMSQPEHNVRPSRETLYQVRRRLQSLHNVLRTYEDTSKSSEKQQPTNQVSEIDAFTCVVPKIEKIGENKMDTNQDSALRKKALPCIQCSIMDGCEYFELDRTEESSSSSLAECSSNTSSKTYQYSSDVALRNVRCKEYNLHGVRRSACRSDLAALAHSRDQLPPFYSAMSHVSGYHEHQNETSTRKQDISDHSRESDIAIEKYGESLTKEATTEEISDALDEEHYRGNTTIVSRSSSRSKISIRSNQERRSTALLLQEALLFKQALLTRVESEKRCLMRSTEGYNDADESSTNHETQVESGNQFPTMVVDIETEESVIDAVHGQLDRRYVRLEMKQRSDLFPRGLRDANALAHCESEGHAEKELARETPSEYFSFCDLAIPSNEEIESSVPLSLKPPIYEKVISIVIPVDVEHKDTEEDMNVDGNMVGKRLPVMLQLEDLILERVKNIRDYMDIFLHSQNRAISRARRALQGPGERVSSRRSDKAGHVILHDQFAVPFKCDCINRIAVDFLKNHKFENSESRIFENRKCASTGTDINLIPGQSGHDCLTDTKRKESNDVTYDPDECPLSSLSAKEETLNSDSLNDTKHHDHLSPRIRHRSTRHLHQTNSRVKAKSDMSLITGTTKNLNVNLRPKRSHSSLTYRDTLKRIRRTLHQSDVKSHDDTDKSAKCESEARSATSSKSLLLPQDISTRSCIPILRNRLEAARMRHQSNTRSPTRSPLTILWRENACTKSRTTNEEVTRRKKRRHSILMDEGSCAEETALNLTKANIMNGEEIAEELEEVDAAYRDSNVTITNNSNVLSDDRNTEALRIDKRFIRDSKSDPMITECLENVATKTFTIISIMASDENNYPANSFILNTENVCPMTNLLKRETELWDVTVEKKEQEVTVKPSITDMCTSMTDLIEAK